MADSVRPRGPQPPRLRRPWDFPGKRTGVGGHYLLHTLPDLPHSSAGKESACKAGDPGWMPGSGRSPGEGKDYPLRYAGLENSMACLYSYKDQT